MKSARISIFRNDFKQQPNQPDGTGLLELPAQFIAELAQLLQTGQFTGTNQQGEPIVQCRVSVWRADGSTKLILSGQIESPQGRAAYLASKQQQAPAQQGWGQPSAQPAWGAPPQQQPAQQGWGGSAPTPAYPQPVSAQPAPQQWGPPAQAPQSMPMQQPAPSDAPAF